MQGEIWCHTSPVSEQFQALESLIQQEFDPYSEEEK